MILVVGSTGMLGGMVARDLLARDERVRVLVRGAGEPADALRSLGAEVVTGDLKDPASLAKACAGVRQVVTTANSAQRGGADTAQSVDRNGNIALIDAAQAAGVEHFVFVSALGADADSPVEFMQAKAAAESRLKQSGMRYTILQPNLFMEVWIGMVVGMPLQQGRPVTVVGSAQRRHTFIAMDDVAAFTVAACVNSAARDRTLVIGGPDAVSWLDVVRSAERVIGRTIPLQFIQPGEPLPGLPDVVAHIAASLETYDSDFDTTPLASEFDVELTSVDTFMQGMLVPALDA